MSNDTTTVLWTNSAMFRYKVIKLQTLESARAALQVGCSQNRDDSSLESRIKAGAEEAYGRDEKEQREASHSDIAKSINKACALVRALVLQI